MKFKLPLIGLVALSLAACSDIETIEVKNEQGKVIERYQQSKENGLKQGNFELFDDQGRLVEQATYADGKLNGKRILFYPEGAKQYEEHHQAGMFAGDYFAYYPDGQVQLHGQYVNNVATGIWTSYYPGGEKKEEVTFADNNENGPFTEWYKNGSLKATGNYIDGDNEHGELILYTDAGEIMRIMDCDRGLCITRTTEENE